MKKRLMCFMCILILIESTVITAFVFQNFFLVEFDFKFDSKKNIFTVSNNNFWLYVHLTDDDSLKNVFINDGIDREINLNYTDLGIVNYKITDKGCGYEVDSNFADNFIIEEKDMIAVDVIEDESEIVHIRPHSIFRFEKYNNTQKKYTIDYTTEPYFFDE